MWRLTYLYVAVATGALKIAEAGAATKNVAWLKGLLARKGGNRIYDDVVGDFLQKQYERLTA
jgi:hypothetical protein